MEYLLAYTTPMFYSIIKIHTYTKMDELRIACQKTQLHLYSEKNLWKEKKKKNTEEVTLFLKLLFIFHKNLY